MSPPYFPNDVICRVGGGHKGGTEIDVGYVNYPVTTCCGPLGTKSVEELVSGGFGDGWDFWVTWRHRNYLMMDPRTNDVPHDKRREKVNASDQNIFLLDRPLSRGMYVRKHPDSISIGIIRDVEVSHCVQNPVGNVFADLDAHHLEYNWISENMLGAFVTLNGWIGQIVEIEKVARMKFEENSEFDLHWTEKLYEADLKKETFIFPEEWNQMEPHLRFKGPGDKAKFTSTELGLVSWASQPAHKNFTWKFTRMYHYDGKSAEVLWIRVDEVLFLWTKRLPQPFSITEPPKPEDRLTFAEIEELVKQNKFEVLSSISPEDKRVGSTVYVKNSVNTRLATFTYDKWAREYLRELHTKNVSKRNDGNPAAKKSRKCFKRDTKDGYYIGVGQLQESVGIGGISLPPPEEGAQQNGEPSIPAKIIARSSRVIVQFLDTEQVECFESTDLIPVLLDEALIYPVGSIIRVDEAMLPSIGDVPLNPPPLTYGVIVGYDMMNEKREERKAAVNVFRIPVGEMNPRRVGLVRMKPDEVFLHRDLRMSYGDILVRGSPYDPVIGGTFLQALETGNILFANGKGDYSIVSPVRVIAWKSRAVNVPLFDAVVQDVCCVQTPSTSGVSVDDGKAERWISTQDDGLPLAPARQLVTLRDPCPSSASLAFWELPSFVPYDGKKLKILTDQRSVALHYYCESPEDPGKDDMYVDVLFDNMNALDPQRYFFLALSSRMDLSFCAMTGPVSSIYEDILFLFHIRLPSIYHGPADIFFESYFEYDVIPDTDASEAPNLIPFSWHTGTNHEKDDRGNPLSYGSGPHGPFLVRFFDQINTKNLRETPLPISFGGSGFGSFLRSSSTERLIEEIYARTELTRYIGRQIQFCTRIWKREIFSYYRIHLPKFFYRQLTWIHASTKDNTFMGCIADKRDDLLANLHDLMYMYNKYL